MLVTEERGVVRAQVVPHVDEATTTTHDILMASDVRCEVTRFTPGHKKLCAVIPLDGIELPVETRERLVEAISALADEIRVQGVIGDGARGGEAGRSGSAALGAVGAERPGVDRGSSGRTRP